jgi:hypothetical protein
MPLSKTIISAESFEAKLLEGEYDRLLVDWRSEMDRALATLQAYMAAMQAYSRQQPPNQP